MRLPFTITHESATVINEGRPHTFLKGTIQYNSIRDAILAEDWTGVVQSLTLGGSLAQWAKGRFSVSSTGEVSYGGHPLPDSIQHRIREMAGKGESPEPMFNFYERLARNPSYRSVQQLFGFLKHAGIPLNVDGTFLAYKGVKDDFTDCHTGTVDNTPGVLNKMDRNLVSDDPKTPCHYGYHVGALAYASTFHSGGHVVICEVDPEHVVCVPDDYSQQKMRVCEYKVIGHHADIPLSSTIHHEELDEDDNEDWGDDDVSPFTDDDEDDKEEHPLEAEKRQNKKPVNKPTNKASVFARMDAKKLMEQSIDDLRKYAAGPCKIIGASKLPGGKAALVGKIVKLRNTRKR